MEQYKKQFIDFMMESKVLKFGEFTLKSGRKSPFFMNAGLYQTGSELTKLGEYYARAIHDTYGLDFDVLFGPAYKGIPLSVATVMAISKLYGKDVRYCANRKEAKDHGETGSLLGASLKDGDRVVIIEDVTTSGASMEETVPILRAQGDVKILGLMVSLNREEVGLGGKVSALQEIEAKWGFPAHAIVTMSEVIEYLGNPAEREEGAPVLTDDLKKALADYYAAYGAKKA
ncbi:MAG: orotate phosphoribosyltransferase [Lachnospiraceae bacterium]|jgi:orotate phosphoribosyltransferase|nr:orotate phosphoribosyltransferase [Lachnospiraceae bacterium]MCI1397734.1 orotate phosphoribosyltransferase [Lachnospiraceae bacterium]MCI1423348.1 orotate phosphoribosyltransferase [Lachnospiraceae bacterium]MCI1452235.1 orotate phosphoribosyltransferase [Lachnospiraceae bacterium]MDD5850015.1 orotate phosphoribosyltransferase [Bacillota bacterium]